MKYLFLDNFRGFTNTYIPIEDVNFLVGENSTGKTSMLGILKLISSHEFWFNNIFDTREVNFGHFKDIASINSLDRKSKAKEFKTFLEQVGRESGLFETVDIKKYGRGATAPFELDVMLNKKALNISSVGYGVSQSLPVVVELLARPKGSWYAIQQPEVHLHPQNNQRDIGSFL